MLGGMALSQGILTSADTTALSFENMITREGDLMRTSVTALRAEYLSWSDLVRVTVDNSGQYKLGDFDKWDIIVRYEDGGGSSYSEWLPYTEGTPGINEWQKTCICLDGQPEFFEPGLLNPEEELIILARLNPLPGDNTSANLTLTTQNGISDSIAFFNPGYTCLTPHSESIIITGNEYFQMAEATPGDGEAVTITTDAFAADEVARKILYDENQPSKTARILFPLKGISGIPAQTWTVYYHCRTWGDPQFPNTNGDVNFDIDILVRKADGTLRTTIATNVADAYLTTDEVGTWVTKSAAYAFPGYTVVDDSDYLEIVFYGETDSSGPENGPGYMQIRIDDSTLDIANQTRIEGSP
jgi:hypothetical protein